MWGCVQLAHNQATVAWPFALPRGFKVKKVPGFLEKQHFGKHRSKTNKFDQVPKKPTKNQLTPGRMSK